MSSSPQQTTSIEINAVARDRVDSAVVIPRLLRLRHVPRELKKGVVLYDMRDPRFATGLESWRETMLDVATHTTVVVLRHWILWPRLGTLGWKQITADTVIFRGVAKVKIEFCPLSGERVGMNAICEAEAEMCSCPVEDILDDWNLRQQKVSADGHAEVFETAQECANLLKLHSHELLKLRDTQKFVKTSGRHSNLCKSCFKSLRFWCSHLVLNLGQDRDPLPENRASTQPHEVKLPKVSQRTEVTLLATTADDRLDHASQDAKSKRWAVYDPFNYQIPYGQRF